MKWGWSSALLGVALAAGMGLAAYGVTHPLPLAYGLGIVAAYRNLAPAACRTPGNLAAFSVYRIRMTDQGFVVFYAAECSWPGGPAQAHNGHAEFLRQGLSASVTGHQRESELPSLNGSPTQFSVYNLQGNGLSHYSVVKGRVFVDTVSSVAVSFANGAVLRDGLMGGRFAVVLPEPFRACEIHMLDDGGSVVYRYDVSENMAPPDARTCPP
jgi:hypothetical protein